jgi:3D (Asp-Asp-Asp) domain-containing protein
MKLFVRGGIGLVAMLFAAFLTFYAQPLSAITIPSQGSAPQEQEQKKKQIPAVSTQQADHAVDKTGEVKGEVSSKPAGAVKELDSTAAATVKVNNTAEPKSVPLTKPQAFTAFSYSLCCRGASGLGVRRGTIAADPRVLPYGTRVYLTGAGSYDGEYLVTDAGTAIKGNKIDVWVPTMKEARRFGRKNVKLTVLSYGGKKKR